MLLPRQAIGAQRTAVADPMAQDVPGVRKVGLVFPDDLGHLAKVMRLDLAVEAEGDQAGEPGIVGFQLRMFYRSLHETRSAARKTPRAHFWKWIP